MSARIGVDSSWKTPIESPAAISLERLGIVEGDLVDGHRDPRGRLDELQGIGDDVEVPQPQKVHLEESELLDTVHLVLGDDGSVLDALAVLGLALDGEILGEGVLGDHHGGGMDAILAAQTFEALRHVDDPLDIGIGFVHLTQLTGHLVAVGVLGVLLEAGVERGVAAHHQRWHGLGHAVADHVGVPQHPGGIAHRSPGFDLAEGHDLGHVVAPVAFGRVADHLVPVAGVEVHVDVGHRDPGRVEEPFEEQVVVDRVEVGDPEAVGDRAARRTPPPRADPDPGLTGMADQVPGDEEVRR